MNERTSKRVAKIAGRVLAIKTIDTYTVLWGEEDGYPHNIAFPWKDIRALAASCLTQTPDKPKKVKSIQRRGLAKPARITKKSKVWSA